MKNSDIKLRKFPYPFSAACTICNDIDRTDWATFVYIHNLLNVELGLEIGDSFWMYSVKPETDDAFSYFDGTDSKKSPYAEKIAELISSGYIDCLHSYGNFSQKGGFARELAQRALNELKKQDLKLEIWTEHGDIHNFQNIGNLGDLPFAVAADGTKTKVQEYHTDLLIDYGVKFIWKNELSMVIGQDRNYSLLEYLFADGFSVANIFRRFWGLIKVRLRGKSMLDNRLLKPMVLRDGCKAYSFTRFGAWDKGTPSALPELLSKKSLGKLIKRQGYMIIYNHLGKETCDGKGLHDGRIQSALFYLKNENEAGNIFVTTTARMLRYNMVRKSLIWDVKRKGGIWVINVESIQDPIFGKIVPNEDILQGITFNVPYPERTKLLIRGENVHFLEKSDTTLGIRFSALSHEGVGRSDAGKRGIYLGMGVVE